MEGTHFFTASRLKGLSPVPVGAALVALRGCCVDAADADGALRGVFVLAHGVYFIVVAPVLLGSGSLIDNA